MAVSNVNDDMSGSFVLGYHTKGYGKEKRLDLSYEYISKFKDSFGEVILSMYNVNFDWRFFTQPNEDLQPFIRFGSTGILSFELLGESFETESFWWNADQDGGILFGFGFLYNNNLIFSYVKHSLNISDYSGSIYDWYSIDFDITRVNFSFLF